MNNKKNKRQNNKQITKIEDLNWKQINKLNRKKTIFYQPISPLEIHGPHLPIGTDLFTSKDTAAEAIKKLQEKKPELNYILLPAIPIGYCKFATDFPGSISINSKTVRDVIYSVGSSLAEHDFRYLIICTYHMAIPHLKGIYQAMKKLQKKYNMKICEPWGPYFYSDKIEKNEPKLGFDTSKEMHAGFRETSLMKYQYPYLVDESYKNLQNIYRDLNSPRVIGKKFKDLGLKDGYVGSPSKADVNYGRWFFNETVKVYVKSTLDLYDGKKQDELPKKIKAAMKALFWS